MRFRTETGSVYRITADPLRWSRESDTSSSGTLRSVGGELTRLPDVYVGEPVQLWGPPFFEGGAAARLVLTSPVTEILPEDSDLVVG